MVCNSITLLLVYKDLYGSTYKDLIKYGLTPDQASRKANIYCVKNTWLFFTSEDDEAKVYRLMFYDKLRQEELNKLPELKEADETVS